MKATHSGVTSATKPSPQQGLRASLSGFFARNPRRHLPLRHPVGRQRLEATSNTPQESSRQSKLVQDRPAHHEVLLTRGAEQDLESIDDDISGFDSVANANHVLDRLMAVVEGFARFPERGSHPGELVALGIKDYRQTAFKPYRVICRVLGSQIVMYLIVDGRRDMQLVLARRLLGA